MCIVSTLKERSRTRETETISSKGKTEIRLEATKSDGVRNQALKFTKAHKKNLTEKNSEFS